MKFGIPYSPQSPDIGKNSDGGISVFQTGQFLIKGNCDNSRTNDDIYMTLGPVTKLDKRNKTTAITTMTSCQKTVTSLLFFQFTANLEQSRSRIPYAQSVKLTFSLTVTFYLTKTENRTKISQTQFSLSKGTIFTKKR